VSLRHLWAITKKEIAHILRDRTTLVLVLFSPTLLLLLMAYALTVDLRDIPLAVFDQDQSQMSRAFIQQITAGEDLTLFTQVNSLQEVDELLTRGSIKAAVVIHPGFSADLMAMRGLNLQIIIDGTEPESGGFAVDHIGWRAEEFINLALADRIQAMGLAVESLQPIDLRVRAWYNPSLKPRVDLIPGLISMVLALPALSVALTLSHEREHGTLEQLMATPVGRTELLVGKMIPYILVGQVNVILIPALAVVWFEVPFHGSFPLFFFLSAIFMFAVLSMGVLIGVFIRTQAAALALAFLLLFFPAFFLTGIFFPIASMPDIVRLEAMGLPGTHYAIITRGVFLPGVGLDVLFPFGIMLLVLGIGFTGIGALFFRKKIG
jgi:ABC-2 type transport system permease protein